MSEYHYYQKALSSLGLSFEECVYTIAFGLETEILQKGKEAVFAELPCRERMAEYVQEALDDAPVYAYALRKTLGFPVLEGSEEPPYVYWFESMEKCFCDAVEYLQRSYRTYHGEVAIRYILIGGMYPQAQQEETLPPCDGGNAMNLATNAPDLFTQIQQMVSEVRSYQRKCEEGLAAIEALLTKMKSQSAVNVTTSARAEQSNLDSQEEDTFTEVATTFSRNANLQIQGSISQIHWPKRSREVLRGLKIRTLKAAMDYFSDFDNFVNGKNITFWEWSVIRMTLWREGLLSSEGLEEVDLSTSLETMRNKVGPNTATCARMLNRLKYGHVNEEFNRINTVGDLVEWFSDGAEEGWYLVRKIRDFGKTCVEYMVEMMRSWMIIIPLELCDPTAESKVVALDPSRYIAKGLSAYQIETISELMNACGETNRFSGLRYFDSRLYGAAVECLKDYGFMA